MAKNKTLKAKITLTDFRPARLLAEKADVTRMLLGTLIGRATGTVKRQSPDGSQTFIGLGGEFQAHVAGDDEPVSSGVLFMPDTFINPLIEIISDKVDEKTGEVKENGAEAVLLAYHVFAVRANNAQQRSWELEAIADPKAEEPVDALAGLRALVTPPTQAALEDKSADKKKK